VLEPFGDFKAGHFGQLDVHDDQVRTMLAREIQRVNAVARADGLVAMCLQQVVEELHVELVVLHDQDGFGHPAPPAVPARLPLPVSKPERPRRPRRANGQNLSKTLVAMYYGKANGNAESPCYHTQWRRIFGGAGARVPRPGAWARNASACTAKDSAPLRVITRAFGIAVCLSVIHRH